LRPLRRQYPVHAVERPRWAHRDVPRDLRVVVVAGHGAAAARSPQVFSFLDPTLAHEGSPFNAKAPIEWGAGVVSRGSSQSSLRRVRIDRTFAPIVGAPGGSGRPWSSHAA